METCPYCNEFMEIAAERADCPHLCADPRNEWCCLNCYAHFDLDLREVPIDDEFAISQRPSTPTESPSQNPSTPTESKGEQGESSTGEKDNGQDSSQESNAESSKGDSSKPSKDDNPSENPSQPQPPQNLTLASQKQIALAKQIYTSLKSYNNYTKINTDIIPVITSLQDFLAQDFLAKESIA